MEPEARARERIDELLAAAGWAVQERPAINLHAARGVAVTELSFATGRARLHAVRRRQGARHRRGQARGVPAHRRLRAVGEVHRRPAARHPGVAPSAALRLREHRRRDALHQPPRPRPAQPRDVRLPPPRDAARLGPGGQAVRPAPARDAAADHRPPLAGAGPGDHQPRALARRQPAARADPDGDRLGQDLHRRQRRLPARQVRRRPARPVPRRPRQPRPPDAEGVPAVHARPTTAASSPSCTTSSTSPRTRIDPRRPRHASPRSSGSTRCCAARPSSTPELDEHSGPTTPSARPRARRRSPTTRRSRSRRSTSSSSTSATARSTASGGRCSSTSTPSSIGLTATPTKQTFGFFNQNLVMEYGHEQAVADGVNVDFDVYRIRTEITEQGSTIDAGFYVDQFRDRQTRADALGAARRGPHLRRAASSTATVVAERPDPHRARRRSATGSSPRSSPAAREVPKTLIFAKDDTHADDIVRIVPRGVRQGQRLRREDHLPDHRREARGPARLVPQLLQPAHRRHRRHDRHRHRRQAARVRVLHALGRARATSSSR